MSMNDSKQIKLSHYELCANQEILFDLPQTPYILILAIYNDSVSNDWRNTCSDWIVKSKQCYWALAWGYECSIWDDALDWSYIESYDFEVPNGDDFHFLTTWHEDQTLQEVIEFSQTLVIDSLPTQDIYHIVILNIR